MKADMLPAVIDPGREMGRDAVIGGAGRRQRPIRLGRAVSQRKSATRIPGGLIAMPCVNSWAGARLRTLELRQYHARLGGHATTTSSHASIPTKKQHLSALRCFFDRLVLRHAVALNPAASVRGERYHTDRGQNAGDHGRPGAGAAGLNPHRRSRRPARPGHRRESLIYTAARIGAVAGLTVASFAHDGSQSVLTFLEKGRQSQGYPRARRPRSLPHRPIWRPRACGRRPATARCSAGLTRKTGSCIPTQ